MTKEKPKITILIDWYLPGTKAGGPVRSIYSVISLIKAHFDIYLLTSACDLGSENEYPDIKTDTLVQKDGVNYIYFSRKNLTVENIVKQINSISPSLIYLNSFWSYHFSVAIIKAKRNSQLNAPVLLAPRGMLGKGAMSLKSFKKNIYLLMAKQFNWYNHVIFHATNEQEKADIGRRFKNNKILIASNINSGTIHFKAKNKEVKQIKLFFLSRISKVKNLHFAFEILKSIPSEINVEYDIFGNREDDEYWKECELIIQSIPSNVKITYKGELAFDQVQETIENYQALFLPTLNENYGHSIVESLLCGCPVIISDQTPWNDLEISGAGYAIDLQDKQKFSNAIIEMANMDNDAFNIKSKQAINYISNKLNLENSIEQYKNLFNESIKH